MSQKQVYVALQQFCQDDDGPRIALERAGCEVRVNTLGRRPTPTEIISEAREADAIIAGVEPYDSGTLQALPRLRCISRCGVGTDAIDLQAADRLGIKVANTAQEVIEPVAQITIAMVFALARGFPQYVTSAREGRWQRYPGFLLSEWTIGLIGFGRIGRAVEEYLRPFHPRVIVTDPNVRFSDVPESIELLDLKSLLARADVVSIHATRAASEGVLLGAEEFAGMKRGSRLINTSRGYLVDEGALYEALKTGHLGGAALDVFQNEPYSGPLQSLPQVMCTPHVSSLTGASRRAMELRAAMNVIDFLGEGG